MLLPSFARNPYRRAPVDWRAGLVLVLVIGGLLAHLWLSAAQLVSMLPAMGARVGLM
jgi:hypothetical protein